MVLRTRNHGCSRSGNAFLSAWSHDAFVLRHRKGTNVAPHDHLSCQDALSFNFKLESKRVIRSTRRLFQVRWNACVPQRVEGHLQFSRHPTQRQRQERQTEQVNGPRVLAKVNQQVPRAPNVFTRVRAQKTGSHGLEKPTSERSQETWKLLRRIRLNNSFAGDSWFDGWSVDEWSAWSSVDGHGWEEPSYHSAGSCSLGSYDLDAVSSPKRFEWVKMNLDVGAVVNIFPFNFGPDGAGGGRFFGTASGVSVFLTVELGSFKVTMTIRLVPIFDGRLTNVHEVLCAVREESLAKNIKILFGIRRRFRASSAQQNWPEGTLRTIGESVRKETAHSSLH